MENSNEWQLFHLATAFTGTKRLEKQRVDFHRELHARAKMAWFIA